VRNSILHVLLIFNAAWVYLGRLGISDNFTRTKF